MELETEPENEGNQGLQPGYTEDSAEYVRFLEDNLITHTKHSRTPSGNSLTDTVVNNRVLFSPKIETSKRKRSGEDFNTVCDIRCSDNHVNVEAQSAGSQSTVTGHKKSEKIKAKARKLSQHRHGSVDSWVNKHQRTKSAKHIEQLASSIEDPTLQELENLSNTLKAFTSTDAEKMKERADKNLTSEDETNSDMETGQSQIEEDKASTSEEKGVEAVEGNTGDNPNVMSVITVQTMFAELRKEIKTLKQSVSKLEEKSQHNSNEEAVSKCKEEIIQKVTEGIQKDDTEIEKLRNDLKFFKLRNRTLTDVVQRMAVEMDDIKQRLDNVESSGARKAVSITGLYLYGQKHEKITQLEGFIDQKLGVQVSVDEIFMLGSKEPKTVIAYLQSVYDKRQIMKYKHYLKKHQNKDGKPVFINEYTPATPLEKMRKEKKIKEDNEKRQKPLEIKYVKGALTIQGETFKPKVSIPTPKEMVDLEPEEITEILKMDLQTANPIHQDRSVFQGYTATVRNYQEIRKLYIKAKLMQPSARHIICAYNLPGEPTYYTQGHCDDGEPAAGRLLLEWMVRNKMVNRVIFVSRKYGGVRMGMDRFECYIQAAKAVLMEHPFNKVLQKEQKFMTKVEEDRRKEENRQKKIQEKKAKG